MLNIHATLAAMTHTPEWQLNPAEAESLARAIATNARHYNIPTVAPKITDGVNLVMVLFALYGTRLAAIRVRRAREEAQQQPQPFYNDGLPAPVLRTVG